MNDKPKLLSEEQKKKLKKLQDKYLPKTKTKKKGIDRTEEYMDFKSGKKDEGYKVMEAAKGGIVKKFKGGLMVKPKAAKRGY